MARYTVYTSNLGNLGFVTGTRTIATTTHVQIKAGLGTTDYYGTGFTFSPTGITGGTITQWDISYNGILQQRITGLSSSAAALDGYIKTSNNNALQNYIFGLNDTFNGSSGNDTFYAHGGNDILWGNAGNDTINGGAGNDTMYGGTGNDTFDWDVNSRGGSDTMYGGTGNDTYVLDSAFGDLVGENAGEGTDLIWANFNATLASLPNVENLALYGTGNLNATGNASNNVLYANSGNNVLNGGLGIDTADYTYSGRYVNVNLALATAQTTVGSGSDTLIGIENLTGSNYNDKLTGSAIANVINGGAGNDIIEGGAGNDVMYGGAGNDNFDFAAAVRGGNDTMRGGVGDDVYTLDNAGDQVFELAGQGTDLVWVCYSATLTEGGNIENLGLYGTGNFNATGNSLNNVIYGNTGNNILNGGAGIDTVSYNPIGYTGAAVTVSLAITTAQNTGGDGIDTLIGIENLTGSNYNDSLTGNAANNVLFGANGNDRLIGGAGNDVLCGGLGKDTMTSGTSTVGGFNYFDFNAINESVCGINRDVITDFQSGSDKIDLYHIDANTLVAGNQAFTLISGASAFTGAGQIKLVGNILYGNVNGDNVADFEIALNVTTIAAGDFIL